MRTFAEAKIRMNILKYELINYPMDEKTRLNKVLELEELDNYLINNFNNWKEK